MKKILYIGNNLTKKTKYYSSMELLYRKLLEEGYDISISSNKEMKILRIIDMLFTIFISRKKTDYILIDTFSTTNFYYAYLTSQLARILKINYIPILHGGNLPARLVKNIKLSNAIFNHSFINVAPSNYLKESFNKKGYDVTFIPNIIEIENYKFKKRNIINPKLLFVRAFGKIYNPTMAIKVLNEVKKTFPDAKLCMIGPTKDGSLNDCKQLAKKLGIENNIEFTGVLSKKEWHKKSEEFDIFINTTNFDNTPVSVMESMALGLPIISTNAGGIPYLINNNMDGILVNKNDYLTMSHAIIDLIKNPTKAINLTNNARKKVINFDWEQISKQWDKILQQ